MKFRIKKENGLYHAEYKSWFSWWFITNSVSSDIEKTKEACEQFMKTFDKPKIIEKFEL